MFFGACLQVPKNVFMNFIYSSIMIKKAIIFLLLRGKPCFYEVVPANFIRSGGLFCRYIHRNDINSAEITWVYSLMKSSSTAIPLFSRIFLNVI